MGPALTLLPAGARAPIPVEVSRTVRPRPLEGRLEWVGVRGAKGRAAITVRGGSRARAEAAPVGPSALPRAPPPPAPHVGPPAQICPLMAQAIICGAARVLCVPRAGPKLQAPGIQTVFGEGAAGVAGN